VATEQQPFHLNHRLLSIAPGTVRVQPAGQVRDEAQHDHTQWIARWNVAVSPVLCDIGHVSTLQQQGSGQECLPAPVAHILMRLITCRMGRGLFVLQNSAEIAQVEPAEISFTNVRSAGLGFAQLGISIFEP
jgi:hypothetical protein